MNTLTTRKIVFGMLMALVLAFSVQGIADALTFSTSRSGDLETKAPNQEFTVRFTPSPKGNTPIMDAGERITQPWSNAPSGQVEAATGTQYYIDSSGYLLHAEDGKRVNTNGNLIDSSGYFINADGEFVNGAESDTVVTSANKVRSDTVSERDQVKVSDQLRYHYNSEAIGIDFEGNARIIKVGSRDVSISDTDGVNINDNSVDLVMYERSHSSYDSAADHKKLSGGVTLVLEPTGAAGTVTVKITDETPDADAPTNGKADPITFTLYVVSYNLQTDITALSFSGLDDNYANADDQFDSPIEFSVLPASAPVKIEIVEGPGRLYVLKSYADGSPDSEGRAAKEINISSSVGTTSDIGGSSDVHLDAGGGTNRIEISAPGRDPVYAIYVFGRPDIQIVSGNDQRGATSGRLADPLVVKVRDARGRGIPMAIVTFDTDETDANFFPVPGTIVFLSEANANKWGMSYEDIDANIDDPITATSSYPETNTAGDAVVVQTDSNGEAKVYFQLGSDTEDRQAVTVNAVGAAQKTFRATATAVVSTDASTITIVDGDGQRAAVDEPLDDPLVVLVRDSGGRIVADALVTFTTNSGELSAPEPGDPGEEVDDSSTDVPDHTALFIVVKTNDTGQASVRYNVGDLPGAKQVFARIAISNGRTRTKTFNVNGRAAPVRDDVADEDEEEEEVVGPPVSVSVPSTVTGTAGGTATLTVTAAATETVTIGGLGDTFLTSNASSVTRSGTTFTSTLTLPDQVADFSLTVFVGNTRYPVTVSVTEAPSQTGALTVRVDPFSGVPGTTATVTVTATDSSDQPANVTVNLSATGGTLASSSVTTGTDGTVTVSLARGSTAGSNNFVTASANDYDSVQSRFLITGTAPPVSEEEEEEPEAGEPAFVEIYDGDNQSGPLNAQLRDAFVVEVLDEDDNPVEDVRVGFQVTEGSGRISPRSARTDESGFAEVNFTPDLRWRNYRSSESQRC